MNVFAFFDHGNGRKELVTPPLDQGIILPGVTRRSIIELVSEWGEFEVTERKVTMKEIVETNNEGKLVEMFGAGTAAIVSPIGERSDWKSPFIGSGKASHLAGPTIASM